MVCETNTVLKELNDDIYTQVHSPKYKSPKTVPIQFNIKAVEVLKSVSGQGLHFTSPHRIY